MNSSLSTTGKTKIKIVLLGNQGVGKSCIIQRYVKDHFDETHNPTVGIDFLVKNVTYHTKSYRIQLWDTAGQQRFRALIPNYLKDAKCALIIFDVASKSSLNNAELWLKLFNDNRSCEGGNTFALLIGNKIDLQYREVEQEQAKKKADQLNLPYFQVSAKTGQNIQQLFKKMIDITQKNSINGINFELNKKQNEMIEEEQKGKQDDTQGKQNKQNVDKIQKKQQKNGGTQTIGQNNTKKFVLEKDKVCDQKGSKKKNDCC